MTEETRPDLVTDTGRKWYQDVTLKDAEKFIMSNMQSAVRSVIAIGYYLKCIRDGEMYREAGYESIWEYAEARYGFSKSTASRYMSRNDRFSVDGNSPIIAEEYRDYSKTQLQEMLSLNDNQLGQVTPDMTVRQIRELRQPKEIPYYEIPGQMSIDDLDDNDEDAEPVATSQREEGAAKKQQEEPTRCENSSGTVGIQNEITDREVRDRCCKTLARHLIKCWHDWFLKDFQRRVMNVVTSKDEILEKNGRSSSRTWYFEGPDGVLMHANLFDDYVQFWGNDCLGNCDWFYLCAAIQSTWNDIALEEAEKKRALAAEMETITPEPEESENCLEEPKPQEELNDLNLLRKMLEKENKYLTDMLEVDKTEKLPTDIIRKKQLLVAALAGMVCDLDNEEMKQEQPKLPQLKNNDQRAAFIDAYETWPIWFETKETGERYYRYELPEAVFVVKVYYHKCFDYGAVGKWEDRFHDAWGGPEYYLMMDGKYFKDCQTNRSALIDYLKTMQKKG